MTWTPLSKRGKEDPRLDEPTEGLPEYLAGPVNDWLHGCFKNGYSGSYPKVRLEALQLKFKLEKALNWSNGGHTAALDLLSRVRQDETFGLDLVDFVLAFLPQFCDRYENMSPQDRAENLEGILRLGGSAWEVAPGAEEDTFQLSRRAVGPVREAVENVPASSRAHQHLVDAWNRLAGRNPDPSFGYRESIRAVEAAAKPIVLPNNDKATLGQMIAALRDKPEKWATTMGSVDQIREMMEIVWTSQLDRHGTDDESVPLTVSPEEADAAFAICLNLSRLFTGGHIAQV